MSSIEFTRASDVRLEEPSSLILEARVNGIEIATVLCRGGKWEVIMGAVTLTWEEFVDLTARFSTWVASESEVMFKEILNDAKGNDNPLTANN
jgi:hypothetical protein